MTTAIERAASSGALALASDQHDWTPEQAAALVQLGLEEASPADLKVFLHQSQRTGLDPFARQIYMIGRWDSRAAKKKYTIQSSIDGLRIVAERHGQYGGQVGPEWCGDDGVWHDVWVSSHPPTAARVGVVRKDWERPCYAVALFREYAATRRDGGLEPMWHDKGCVMIAKCFSEDTEVLTEHGYRRFADVGDARIMQVTGGGLEAVTARPFVQDYDGLMVTLDSDDLNFSVTPNHDMVTTVGKVEAGAMYETARSRPTWSIPRIAPASTGAGLDVSDEAIRLAAVIVADGTVTPAGWRVEVSRPAKVAALDALGMFSDRYVRGTRGDEATSRKSGRVVRSNFDKQGHRYPKAIVSALVDDDKHLYPEAIRAMTSKQARILVDTLIEFDGSENRKTGVRRFYSSDGSNVGAFELAAAIAGYTTGQRRERVSDLSDRPNWCITISGRDAIGVIRASDGRTGLELTPNASGRVWCVTVPSGRIMVRRNGFAMVCGNCAEALALRKAFPHDLSGIYTSDEMDQADNPPVRLVIDQPTEEKPAVKVAAVSTEIDWDAEIAKCKGDKAALGALWKRAPKDSEARTRIAAAAKAGAAAQPEVVDGEIVEESKSVTELLDLLLRAVSSEDVDIARDMVNADAKAARTDISGIIPADVAAELDIDRKSRLKLSEFASLVVVYVADAGYSVDNGVAQSAAEEADRPADQLIMDAS